MKKYILVAESGADIPPKLAQKHEIFIVPMHVSFGDQTKDDGAFPVEEVFSYYKTTKTLPTTSGCSPEDFKIVFDAAHQKYPDGHILHLAYSAVTSCSYQSGVIAAEGRDYVTNLDTKFVTIAQGFIVLAAADYLEKNPDCSLEEACAYVEKLCNRCRLSFFPGDLLYLKAGGRVSNAAYLGAKILSLSPQIELKNGELVATRKYRGKMKKNAVRLLEDMTEEKQLGRQFIAFVYSPGLAAEIRGEVTQRAKQLGFERIEWLKTGCVIAAHAGEGAFGICGFTDSAD